MISEETKWTPLLYGILNPCSACGHCGPLRKSASGAFWECSGCGSIRCHADQFEDEAVSRTQIITLPELFISA